MVEETLSLEDLATRLWREPALGREARGVILEVDEVPDDDDLLNAQPIENVDVLTKFILTASARKGRAHHDVADVIDCYRISPGTKGTAARSCTDLSVVRMLPFFLAR